MNDELRQRIEDEEVEGWELHEERGEDSAVLVKRKYGSLGAHALIALLTVWWTFGIGNVLYAAYKYFGDSDKKVVRVSEETV